MFAGNSAYLRIFDGHQLTCRTFAVEAVPPGIGFSRGLSLVWRRFTLSCYAIQLVRNMRARFNPGSALDYHGRVVDQIFAGGVQKLLMELQSGWSPV